MKKLCKSLMIVALACVALARTANADVYQLISAPNAGTAVGGTLNGVNTSITGGGIFNSKLNGVALQNNYCLDISEHISLTTYSSAVVTSNGTIYGHPENNAGSIAWLLKNENTSGTNTAYKQAAMQGLIWELVSPNAWSGVTPQNFVWVDTLNTSTANTYHTQYKNDLAAALSASGNNLSAWISLAYWISPGPSNTVQAQVALNPNVPPPVITVVPEPSSFALAGLGGIGLLVNSIRRRRAAVPC